MPRSTTARIQWAHPMIIFSSAKDTPSSLSHAKIVSEWHMGQDGGLDFSLRFKTCFACCAERPSLASAFLLPLDVPLGGAAGLPGMLWSSGPTEPALFPRRPPLPPLPPLPLPAALRSSAAASSCSPATVTAVMLFESLLNCSSKHGNTESNCQS